MATRGFFASLLRPLLVLLLVVGSVTAERVRAADRTLRAIDESFRALGLECERTFDDRAEAAHVFRTSDPVQVFARDQELVLPEVLPEFRVAVGRFFE